MNVTDRRSMQLGMNPNLKTDQRWIGSIRGRHKRKRGRRPDNRMTRVKHGTAPETTNGIRDRTQAPGNQGNTDNTSKASKASSNVKAGGER